MTPAKKKKRSLREIYIESGFSRQQLVDAVNELYPISERVSEEKQKAMRRPKLNTLSLTTLKDTENNKTRISSFTARAIQHTINRYRRQFELPDISMDDIEWRVQGQSPISQKQFDAIQKMREANRKVKKDKGDERTD